MATNKHCTPIGCTPTSSHHSLTCTAHRHQASTLSHARNTDIKPSLFHMHGTPTSSHHSLTCTEHRHQAVTLSHAQHTDIKQALSHMHGTPPPAIPHSPRTAHLPCTHHPMDGVTNRRGLIPIALPSPSSSSSSSSSTTCGAATPVDASPDRRAVVACILRVSAGTSSSASARQHRCPQELVPTGDATVHQGSREVGASPTRCALELMNEVTTKRESAVKEERTVRSVVDEKTNAVVGHDRPNLAAAAQTPSALDVFFILRASRRSGGTSTTATSSSSSSRSGASSGSGSRWSGQVAFPGGHVECGETDVEAVSREVREEVGLDLERQGGYRLLGEVTPRRVGGTGGSGALVLRCMVFLQLDEGETVVPDPSEVFPMIPYLTS
jgi:8-oxo-dGTP pyrophosphatase MutT (NUDIX family)